MKHRNNKQIYDILRWIALLPAVCLVWWIVLYICISIDQWFSTEPFFGLGLWVLIIYFAILPAIAMFFTAKYIAPKYKNIMGCVAVFLCIAWVLLLCYGLSHIAY